MDRDTLAFIGGGNMAKALIGGLVRRGWPAGQIRVADPLEALRAGLAAEFPGIHVCAANAEAAAGAGTWVLAVKPQVLRDVSLGLRDLAQRESPVVVSVAAGIRAADLERWLGPGVPVIRTMPNRPALLGCGVTGLYAARSVAEPHRARAAEILAAVGSCVWVEDEALMDAVTAVSGSGPAYFFLLVEMLEAAAQAEGLPAGTARQLAVETAYGAVRMAHETGEEPAALREQVTSKGGTTAAALAVLEEGDLRGIFARAINAARRRSAELADQFGG